ncbi:hypothetical protein PHAVU_007G239900 [Phaseolus vulgaris]|uniref:RRM domain-containing protein n=1 Tax=Phaseolus vulgaris TaxID=3885 RepID=V7BK64_PHAVU|nr:hypothetical protein PHAVU_007G239900g [Phaseolus vulgaris]ESW17440.1 hypothetical protein PHAVU_007G239900g [Phaseolus vulgaris]
MACFLPCSDLGTNVTVSREEFFSFHNIDRLLFTRLVVGLGRDTSQSTHVMAFFMWLEKQCKDMCMVKKLLQWADPMINSLADEAIMVLNCIESPHFPYDDAVNDESLPLIRSILHQSASFKYFYHNRVAIIEAVTKLLDSVCVRAFTDIIKEVQYMKVVREQKLEYENLYGSNPYVKQVVYHNTPVPGVTIVSQQPALPPPQWGEGSSTSWETNPNMYLPLESYGVSNQHFNDLVAMMNQTSISAPTSDETQEVPVDDRIIFMTFSKGYPISEAEVRAFFARRYGDIVEALYMQEVVPPDQPLYARVVIRSRAIHLVDYLLESTNKVKLSINGKHAWARKYLRKGNKSPRDKSPVTSRPPSPTSSARQFSS